MGRNHKIVLLGDEAVGKTTLVYRLHHDRFEGRREATIGVSFVSHPVKCKDKTIDLHIWDTAGQDRFHHFLPLYLHHAELALVCFELPYLQRIENYVKMASEKEVKVILVATKIDLFGIPTSKDKVALVHPEVEKYAEENGLELYYTSSKLGQNVKELFSRAAELVEDSDEEPDTLDLDLIDLGQTQSRCC